MLKEAVTRSADTSVDTDALVMALKILKDRIRGLPSDDLQDLYELTEAFREAESDDEVDSAFEAIREILKQAPIKVSRMEPPVEISGGLSKWIDFVSKRIAATRKAAGLTQTELAERSGLPQSHISRLERGKHSPSAATLEKLAGALDVPLSKLDPSA